MIVGLILGPSVFGTVEVSNCPKTVLATFSQGYDTPNETYGAQMTQEEVEQIVSVVTTNNPPADTYGATLETESNSYGASINAS